MSKPANISRLSPLRRGYIMGLRRARAKARAEMHNAAAHWEAELEALQDDFHELAVSVHRERYDRALDKAIELRAMDADIVYISAGGAHSALMRQR